MREETNPPEESSTTIFLVEEDDDARRNLTKNLRKLGYRLLVAAHLDDAREWVSGNGHIHADLVLIDLVGKTPEEAVSLGRELRDHAKYNGHTPLIVMPEKVADELAGTDVNVSEHDWICYYEDAEQLQTLLGRLTGKDSGVNNIASLA
jgi:DNA-binding response OmpR family regulator